MTDPFSHIQQELRERYVVERELGRGGMAFVYLAMDRRYQRQVAIKVLDPSIATAVGAERFLREIQITAQLQHPHIVPLLDSGDASGLLYSVMPYIEGESLRDRLTSQGRLPPREAVAFAVEVSDALDYAHRRGVVHRDIKPENILISNGHALVADFGIARAIGLAGGATLTGVGLPIGTAAYMSPEQATAASPVDGRSDLYSLGCVLYEMLAGRMAFSGPNLKSVLTQQLTTDPPLVHLSHPDIPQSLISTVQRTLAKAPDARFQTAGELAEALRGSAEQLPRVSTPVPQVPLAPEPAVRPGALATAGRWLLPAALLATVVLGLTVLRSGRRGADPADAASGPYTASVAVLPFDNLNGDSANDYFSEGITQEIIGQLAQVESLKVISRTSVLALKGSNLTLPQIAETLGVRHIVEGAVRRQGSRVRVSAELIEASSDAHLWSGAFEGDLADSFQVQQQIARQVSGKLVSGIRGLRPMTANAMPSQSAAFDALLRGEYLLERRTPESMEEAVRAFQEAVAADSTYAPAYAWLAHANVVRVGYGYPGVSDRYAAIAQAGHFADRALQLDPRLGEAHFARLSARAMSRAPQDELAAGIRDAQRLMPSSAEIIMGSAFVLGQLGRWGAAVQQAQRALALDPLSAGLRHSAILLALGARQYDVALAEAQRARALAADDPVPPVLQAYALLLRGEPAKCAALELSPLTAIKAMCLHALGRTAEAQRTIDSLATELAEGRYRIVNQYMEVAAYYARLGDVDRSLEWMERGVRLTPGINDWELSSGLFDRVGKDPRFQAGLQRLITYVRERVAAERRKQGERRE